jgi:hypothetical protein
MDQERLTAGSVKTAPHQGIVASSESNMNSLAWVIVAIGVLSGGTITILGLRRADQKLLPDRITGALRQDWTPTGNIDFRFSTLEGSFLQPLRLWVEDERITETAVGQRIVELRWRLATIEEGRALVICWNARESAPAVPLPQSCLIER